MIKACAEAGDAARAAYWLSPILKAHVEANTISYNTVVKACAAANDVTRAENRLPTMMKVGVEANTISTVIMVLAEA